MNKLIKLSLIGFLLLGSGAALAATQEVTFNVIVSKVNTGIPELFKNPVTAKLTYHTCSYKDKPLYVENKCINIFAKTLQVKLKKEDSTATGKAIVQARVGSQQHTLLVISSITVQGAEGTTPFSFKPAGGDDDVGHDLKYLRANLNLGVEFAPGGQVKNVTYEYK